MPTPFMHLALAEEVLQGDELSRTANNLLHQQRGPFLLGNTAPDVQTVSGQARIESHFYTLPRTTDRPAHESLFTAHPALARPAELPPAQAAFVAGYITHLLLDELWLDDIFLRFFGEDWASRQQRAFIHNVLRTWADRQDRSATGGRATEMASLCRRRKPARLARLANRTAIARAKDPHDRGVCPTHGRLDNRDGGAAIVARCDESAGLLPSGPNRVAVLSRRRLRQEHRASQLVFRPITQGGFP
jgi:hypothetical protein